MSARDLIGKRGEAIAIARLTDFCDNPVPYFDPHPLGEKCPTYDFLVELTVGGGSVPYFLAQVKSTKQGRTTGTADLKVQVKAKDVQSMVRCPIPTYKALCIHLVRIWEMAQKISQQKRLIRERASALATVYLTRRPDLTIREEIADIGIDLLVSLHPEEKEGVRQFGVEFRGAVSAVAVHHANAVLRPSMQRMLRYGPFPFPVVLFFFTMANDEGWYTWAAEPVIAADGSPELRQHGEADCRPLDDEAVDKIVDQVDRWYDAFFAKTSKTISTWSKGKTPNNKGGQRGVGGHT